MPYELIKNSVTQYNICTHVLCMYMHDDLRWKRKKDRHLRQMKKWKMSCLRWDLNTQHSVLRTDALTNWATSTNAAQLAGSKSNISYTCVNRLTETWYISEGQGIKPPKTQNTTPKYIHDDLRWNVHVCINVVLVIQYDYF